MLVIHKKSAVSALLKILVLVSCVLGIAQHGSSMSDGFMQSVFVAFTTQSNIWIALICIVFLILDTLGIEQKPQWLYTVKFMFTSSILLTWIVFAVLLAPILKPSYILSPSNLFLHSITPILATADFLLFEDAFHKGTKFLWTVLLMPVLYLFFAFISYENLGFLPTYYFFLDYKKLGWFTVSGNGIGTGFWIVLLAVVLLAKGLAILALKKKSQTKGILVTGVALACMLACSLASTIISLIVNS